MDMKINWPKIWEDFNEWLDRKERVTVCKSCTHRSHNTPDWEDQQCKIQRLVNDQVREIVQKKI